MIEIKTLASSSKGNCYVITSGGSSLLLDCGISWREIRKGLDFKTNDIAGCLITHGHKDHSKAVKEVMSAGINCYFNANQDFSLMHHRRIQFNPAETIEIDNWKVYGFAIVHDTPGLGFYIAGSEGDRLLYATDTAYIVPKFAQLNYIMIECNYSLDVLNDNVKSGRVPVELKNRLLKTHFSLEHVKDFLRANDLSQVREIWLLHLSGDNSDAGRFQKEVAALTGKPVFVAEE